MSRKTATLDYEDNDESRAKALSQFFKEKGNITITDVIATRTQALVIYEDNNESKSRSSVHK